MTPKEKVLRMVRRLNDDAPLERVIYNVALFRDLAIADQQIERGQFIDHDDLVKQLEQEWRELESCGRPAPKPTAAESAPTSPKTRRGGRSPSRSASSRRLTG